MPHVRRMIEGFNIPVLECDGYEADDIIGTLARKAEKQGFKTIQTAPFEIGVNQTVTQQLAFALGTASEVIQVTAESTLVDSTTTELGTVIPSKAVNDLPLNGRNFTQLLTLTPGVTPVSTSQNRNVGCCEGNVGLRPLVAKDLLGNQTVRGGENAEMVGPSNGVEVSPGVA